MGVGEIRSIESHEIRLSLKVESGNTVIFYKNNQAIAWYILYNRPTTISEHKKSHSWRPCYASLKSA
jgi:hypothetical protein